MGILNKLIKTAKDVYNADANNQLGEYVNENFSRFINKIDGTEEGEYETQKNHLQDLINEEIESDNFDLEYCRALIERWINEYARDSQDMLWAYFWSYCMWENEFYSLEEQIDKEDDYEVKEQLKEKQEEENQKCIDELKGAINCMDSEESVVAWGCFLHTRLAERLHWAGAKVEAVRTAIQWLPLAADEKEKEAILAVISGKRNAKDVKWTISQLGYGTVGIDIDERIKLTKDFNDVADFLSNKEFSDEDRNEYIDCLAMSLMEDINEIKYGQSTFSNRPYHDRQFIFTVRDLDHIGGCYDETDNIKYVFPLDELPGEITFPVGHPLPNTLYYAHPLKPMYLPFENAQLMLFYERIQEICRLFQCLGATQITARCLKGQKISEDVIANGNMDITGGYKLINASAGFNSKRNALQKQEHKDEMHLEQTFSPKKAPYCPKDLLWAKNDSELQTLIQQRLEGSLLKFSKRVSSFETSSLSQNQITDVKVAFESFMANVSANYSASTDTTFNSTTETEWEISVQFKPLDEFKDFFREKQKTLAKGSLILENAKFFYCSGIGIIFAGTLEQDLKKGDVVVVSNGTSEYESKVKSIIMFNKLFDEADKDDKVWLILDKVIDRELEKDICIYYSIVQEKDSTPPTVITNNTPTDECPKQTSLTPREEKYKDEILFCLEDNGIITDDDRKYLERKRQKFGISEESAREIEQQIVPILSEDEKEYLETFKELNASSTITERSRRLLERERESLNISKERAIEIEKLAL